MILRSSKLGSLVSIAKGKKHQEVLDSPVNGGKRYIQIDDLRNDWNLKYTTDLGVEVTAADVVIAWDGANAGTIGFGLSGYIGSTLARLRIHDEQLSPIYLGWFLRGQAATIRAKCYGATIPHVNKSVLQSIEVPLPPLPIQKQIAAILGKADAAREKRRQANQLTEEFLQSVFLEMFGDPVTNPKGWQTKNLGEIARREKFSIVDGPFGSHLKANEYTDSGVRVIRVNNIKPNSFNFDDVRYVSLEKYDSIKRSTVRPGDIIMAKVGNTIGKTCVFPKSIDFAVLTANVCKITADDAISDAVFISRQMNFEAVQTTIRNLSGDTAKPMINLPRLKQLKLIIPPLSEERKFTHLVEKVESLRVKQRESEKELENLFNSLMQRAFRGELVQ